MNGACVVYTDVDDDLTDLPVGEVSRTQHSVNSVVAMVSMWPASAKNRYWWRRVTRDTRVTPGCVTRDTHRDVLHGTYAACIAINGMTAYDDTTTTDQRGWRRQSDDAVVVAAAAACRDVTDSFIADRPSDIRQLFRTPATDRNLFSLSPFVPLPLSLHTTITCGVADGDRNTRQATLPSTANRATYTRLVW